jgi:hypothetical protein
MRQRMHALLLQFLGKLHQAFLLYPSLQRRIALGLVQMRIAMRNIALPFLALLTQMATDDLSLCALEHKPAHAADDKTDQRDAERGVGYEQHPPQHGRQRKVGAKTYGEQRVERPIYPICECPILDTGENTSSESKIEREGDSLQHKRALRDGEGRKRWWVSMEYGRTQSGYQEEGRYDGVDYTGYQSVVVRLRERHVVALNK